MNCRQVEQWLLLRDAGELSFRKRLRLEEHLIRCAHCRAYRDDLGRVITAARRSLPTGDPAAQTLAAIREAARAGVPPRKETVGKTNVTTWQTVLALAAVLMLCLGGWYWLANRGPSATGPSVAWEQPAARPAAEDNGDWTVMLVADVVMIERISDVARRQEISALDCDLLLLEGLAI